MTEEERTAPPANRMAIAILALVGLLISIYLTLHKYGYIGALVCGTGACETVQTSKWAIFLGVPVPVIGLVGYAFLFALALAGLQSAWGERKSYGLFLFVVADIALFFTIYLSYVEKYLIHAWCRWCIGSAVITVLIWLFALPEIIRLRRAV